MPGIVYHYGVECAAVRRVWVGYDVLLTCTDRDREIAAFEAVAQAVETGTISPERLDQSVARIARLKHRFVAPYKPVTISDAMLVAGCRTHQALLHSIEQVRARLSHPQYS